MKIPLKNALPLLGKNAVRFTWITALNFGTNGLANHAAAGAYGFLLSLMPALLLSSYILYRTVAVSAETAAGLILQMGFLGAAFDIGDTVRGFLNTINPGVSGLITLVNMLWAAIVLAFSLQRGLKSIFFNEPETNPLKNYLVPLGLEIAVILFVVVMVLSTGIFSSFDFAYKPIETAFRLFPLLGMGVLTFGAYCIVPPLKPSQGSALAGTLVCAALYGILSLCSGLFMNPDRYRLIYGGLGDLILFLARVYFFFISFFIGAQAAFTAEFFDALLFTKLRQLRGAPQGAFSPERLLFASVEGPLQKYLRSYEEGDTIFLMEEDSHEVYFILSGEVGIYLGGLAGERFALITGGNFFGEMGHVSSQRRSAAARAQTALRVLVLPPKLFTDILKIDTKADGKLIETLSDRLRNTNRRFSARRD